MKINFFDFDPFDNPFRKELKLCLNWMSLEKKWVANVSGSPKMQGRDYEMFDTYQDGINWLRNNFACVQDQTIYTQKSVGMPDISEYAEKYGTHDYRVHKNT